MLGNIISHDLIDASMSTCVLHGHVSHSGIPTTSHLDDWYSRIHVFSFIPDIIDDLVSGTLELFTMPARSDHTVFPWFVVSIFGHQRFAIIPDTYGHRSSASYIPSLSVSIFPHTLTIRVDWLVFPSLSVTVRVTLYDHGTLYVWRVFHIVLLVFPSQKFQA